MYLKPFGLKKYTKVRDRLAENCPWSVMVDDGVVLLKSGALMRCYQFAGPDVESTSADYINSLSATFNNEIKRLGSSWAIQCEVQRFASSEYPGATFTNPAAFLIDRQREINFSLLEEHYETRYYITFTWETPPDITSKTKNIFFKKSAIHDGLDVAMIEKHIANFKMQTDKVMAALSARIKVSSLNSNDCFTYLHSAVSLDWAPRFLPKESALFLDEIITDQSLETAMTLKLGNHYIPILAINDFPCETYPAMFDNLNKSMIPYRWSTRFICLDKKEALKKIEDKQKQYYSARKSLGQYVLENTMNVESGRINSGAVAQEIDTSDAQTEVMMDSVGYGYYCSNIMVWDEDYDVAIDKAKYLAGIISSSGFGVKEEDHNAFFAFLSMMPGHVYANVRHVPFSTGNLSHVIPLSSIWSGMKKNDAMKELCNSTLPHVVCSTQYGIPHFLNLNVGDVGHTWISGRTGAGKSTLLALLEIQWLKYPDAQVFIFDKDKSARNLTLCVGGKYFEPGKDSLSFQPLANIDTEIDKQWAVEFIKCLLEEQKITISATINKEIYAGIKILASMDKKYRTLSSLQQYCGNYRNPKTGSNDIVDGIEPYTATGAFGTIFDGNKSNLDTSWWTMFEMGTLMGLSSQAVAPALMYLFRELEKLFDGKPTLLVLDEAWLYLKNKIFASRIVEWLKTLRKKNTFVVFATQEIDDAASSDIASTIVSQCVTKIYLADPEATTPLNKEAYKKFGLDDSEINLIATSIPRRDYYLKNSNGTRLFDLSLDKFQLAILTSDNHSLLDEIETQYGKNSEKPLVFRVLDGKNISYNHLIKTA